jgi:hypothetical protein
MLEAGHPEASLPHLQAGLEMLRFLDDREYDRGCESP